MHCQGAGRGHCSGTWVFGLPAGGLLPSTPRVARSWGAACNAPDFDLDLELFPDAPTGFIGVARDERTLEPVPYLDSVPADLEGRPVLVLDPMLATGGSLAFACGLLRDRNPGRVTAVCVLAAPEGVHRIATSGLVDELVVASIDERLNDVAYIVPGLGDAGDRLFGTA